MVDIPADAAIKDYINLLSHSENVDEKLNLLTIIVDIIKYKNSSNNVSKQSEVADYECMLVLMDSLLFNTYTDCLLQDTESSVTDGLLTKLVGSYMEKQLPEAIMAVCSICSLHQQAAWLHDIEAMETLLSYLAEKLAFKQESQSFDVCEYLSQIISSIPTDKLDKSASKSWQKHLHKGLSNMILSKLSPKLRNKALRLAGEVLHSFGVDWLLGQESGKKLYVAATNLACIEIRLCLENKPYSEAIEHYVDIRSSYKIVSAAAQHLICGSTVLSDKCTLQLHKALKEAINIIASFVKESLPIDIKSDVKSELFVILTIETFGSLAAEETRCDSQDIVVILPFFMELMDHQYYNHNSEDLLESFMSALCCLSFDEAPRNVLLKLRIENLLFHYIKHKWDSSLCREIINISKLEQRADNIVVACNIFLNIAAHEPGRLKSENIYKDLLAFIIAKTPQIPKDSELIILNAVFCTVGTAILNQTCQLYGDDDELVFLFIQCVITFLWDAFEVQDCSIHINPTYEGVWETVIEPWLLTVRNVCLIIENSKWIAQYCIDCEWATTFLRYFVQTNEYSVEIDVKNSFEQIFVALHKFSDFTQSTAYLNDMKFVAKKQCMTDLLAILP